MTDRVRSLTVVLERDIREDDVKAIVDAIAMVKGVLDVVPEVADSCDYTARVRVQHEIQTALLKALKEFP